MGKETGTIRIRRAYKNNMKGFALETQAPKTNKWERFAFCYARLHVGPELVRVDIEIVEKLEEALAIGYELVACPALEHEWHGRTGYCED